MDRLIDMKKMKELCQLYAVIEIPVSLLRVKTLELKTMTKGKSAEEQGRYEQMLGAVEKARNQAFNALSKKFPGADDFNQEQIKNTGPMSMTFFHIKEKAKKMKDLTKVEVKKK